MGSCRQVDGANPDGGRSDWVVNRGLSIHAARTFALKSGGHSPATTHAKHIRIKVARRCASVF